MLPHGSTYLTAVLRFALFLFLALQISVATAEERSSQQLADDLAVVEALRYEARNSDATGASGPVRPFETRYDRAVFEGLASKHVQRMAVLEERHGVRISDAELQRELNRVAASTRRPEELRRYFAALDHDPARIAEVLARPQLMERRLRSLYDDTPRSESFGAWLASQTVPTGDTVQLAGNLELPRIIGSGSDAPDSWTRELPEGPDSKQGQSAVWTGSELIVWGGRVPGEPQAGLWTNAGFSYDPVTDVWTQIRLDDTTPEPRAFHSAIWTGSDMLIWGGETWGPDLSPPYYTAIAGGGSYDPVEDRWTALPTDGAPSPRQEHSAAWTGTEMIIWGGLVPDDNGETPPPLVPNYTPLDDGARYDPAFGGWTTMGGTPPTARGRAAAAWTGDILHVVGGFVGNGWLSPQTDGTTFSSYNPATDSWETNLPQPPSRPMPSFEAPQVVWTGESLWVAQPSSGRLLAQYRFGAWSEPPPPPSASDVRYESVVWTGRRLILWGGLQGMPNNPTARGFGLIFDAQTERWSTIEADPPNSPSPRFGHFGFWTGSEMIIWGGGQTPDPAAGSARIADLVADGGRYTPDWSINTDTGSWQNMPLPPLAAAERASMVWTGAELIIWGGFDIEPVQRGAVYDPVLDTWTAMSRMDAPDARFGHGTVWSGDEMLVWGGYDDANMPVDSGGRYDPVTDDWQATGGTPPVARGDHSAVWTGDEMIIWGGYDSPSQNVASGLSSGGRYDPDLDAWQATGGTAPSARGDHVAVWTGDEMLIYGGLTGCPACEPSGEAATYDPSTNQWSATFTGTLEGTVDGRWLHTGIWNGSELVIWGGTDTYLESNICQANGLRIDPDAASIVPLPVNGVPRCRHIAAWNGVEMLVWGGVDRANAAVDGSAPPEDPLNSGARLDLARAVWTDTAQDDFTPTAVRRHSAVWTGEELFIWGGRPRISSNLGVYYTDTHPTASPRLQVDGLEDNPVLLGGDDEAIRLDHTLPTAFFDDVEGDPHWTASNASDVAQPEGGTASWHVSVAGSCSDQGDSISPFSAWRFGVPGTCEYVGSEDTYYLTSDDTYDITSSTLLELRYLLETDAVGNPDEQDVARIEASADGGNNWTTVAIDLSHQSDSPSAVPMDDSGTAWRGLSINLASYVGATSNGKVRFGFELNGSLNGRIGWLIDDIGVGEPAGDGRLPSGPLTASDGSQANHSVANHDLWDRPTFSWDLNGDTITDNDDGSRPDFELTEAELAAYGLAVPGLHELTLTVSDRGGNQESATVTLEVVDGEPPTVEVLSPNGGEAWPAASTQVINWAADDNIGLAGFDVAWYDDEAGSGPHAIACEESLDGDARSCTWTLPDTTSTAVRVEVTARDQRPEPGGPNTAVDTSDGPFYLVQANSDEIRTLVVWHSDRVEDRFGTADKDALGAGLANYAALVKVDGVALDLANVPSLEPLYNAWDGTVWDGASTDDLDDNIAAANNLAEAIRTYLFEQVSQSFTNLEFTVLVGGDDLIPMWRMEEDLPRYPESNYIGELQTFGLLDDASSPEAFCNETESPVMGAMCRDRYLADAPYGASFATTVPGSSFTWYLPDIALGRLVETPAQILGLIDVFIAQDGVTVVDRAMTSGYDFLTDGADAIQGRLLEELDLEATTVDRLSQVVELWTDDDLLDLLFGNPPDEGSDLSFVVGHADHRAEGAAQVGDAGVLSTIEMEASGRSNRGGVMVGVGCHSGLPMSADGGAADETDPAFLLDIPEIMAERSFPVVIGNGGYGWGLSEGVGLGEQLLLLIGDEVLRAGQVAMGEALRLAKQEYFLRQDRLDAFDLKVLHEAMLFGLPNYEVRVQLAADSEAARESSWAVLDGPRADRDAIRAAGPRVPGRPWLGDPDWSRLDLPEGGTLTKTLPRIVEPQGTVGQEGGGASLQILDFSFQAYEAGQDTDGNPNTADWQEAYEQFDWCTDLEGESLLCTGDPDETEVGTFFTLNRLASGEAGRPIQPMISFDSRLFGTELHGILIRGGEVIQPAVINPSDSERCTDVFGTVHPCFNPVVGNPETEVDETEGPAPTPFVNIDSPTPFVNIDSPTSNGFFENGAGGDPIRFDTLNAPMGASIRRGVAEDDDTMQRREIFSQWLYRTRDFTNYYSNSTDWTPPVIGDFTADCSSELDGDDCFHTEEEGEVTFTVPVTDDGDGIFRVFVTFTEDVDEDGNGAWLTMPLQPVAQGVFGGQLTVQHTAYYLIQAVDWAGNVGTVTISGEDVDAEGLPIGSTFVLPQLFTVSMEAEGPPPLFADGFENGDASAWSDAVP